MSEPPNGVSVVEACWGVAGFLTTGDAWRHYHRPIVEA